MKEYSYFPGCSLEATAKEYDMSTREVCRTLGIGLVEIEDWNCCGATAIRTMSRATSVALPARSLAIAEKKELDVVAPCNACFHKLRKAAHVLKDDVQLNETVNRVLREEEGLEYSGKNRIRHLADVFANDIESEELKSRVVKPLEGLKVVPYYGCLIVKAPQFMEYENPERPTVMDNILKSVGADVLDFDLKTRCCGGAVVMTKEEVALKLTGDILKRAKSLGADCVAVLCPMCHFNLDGKQAAVEKHLGEKLDLPILYFTQLMGLAFGIEAKKLGLKRNLVDSQKIVATVSS
ncbi:succinate dehydrogenase/fumarate reductase iron-sulfur subunit [archaeon BMS3Abin16]|nr:succinate dehydrogenase/fumarate reductase iron-sulfur subunit [archaeon BMS3Abin16]